MIVTTTPSVEGRSIREYRGIVSGSAVLGNASLSQAAGKVFSRMGGPHKSETPIDIDARPESLQDASRLACRKLELAADALGATAVVGVSFEHSVTRWGGDTVFVFASGTAVLLA